MEKADTGWDKGKPRVIVSEEARGRDNSDSCTLESRVFISGNMS